jgi:hypothetical protein
MTVRRNRLQFGMKALLTLSISLFCAVGLATARRQSAGANPDQQSLLQALLQADHAVFGSGVSSGTLREDLLEPNFSWTDTFGRSRNKSEILRDLASGKGLRSTTGEGNGDGSPSRVSSAIQARSYGQVGIVQENNKNLYLLRVWVKRDAGWRLLVYQAVSTGAPPSAEPGNTKCENPCDTVPFEPRNEDEREVIHAYQAVERAVTAHDSAAWGAHIAEEFFAITSNSDRPLDKATRMAGLDRQREGGIAPFPLVSARMFEFGDAMVMISRQQPEHGLPLRVTRIWFRRGGVWLEAYSYQTTIQSGNSSR